MTTSDAHNSHDDEVPCESAEPVWPVLLTAGSALVLGYLAGRASFASDLRRATRRIEESPEPIEISIRTL